MPLDHEDNTGVDGAFTVITRKDAKKFVYTEAQGASALQTEPEGTILAAARYGDHPITGSQSARVVGVRRKVAGIAMNNAESSAVASGLSWFKSSYSGAEGGQCVEVANGTAVVHVRDSKSVAGPVVTVSPGAWAGFVGLASSEQRV